MVDPGLAHDLNNLLTVVIGNLGRLASTDPQGLGQSTYLEPALRAAHRGANLLQRWLGVSRGKPPQPGPVDVGLALREMQRLVANVMPPSLRLAVHAPSQPLWSQVEACALDNALLNLLLNARDATGGRGRVTLRSHVRTLAADAAAARSVVPGVYVCIDVHDDGCGMDPTTRQRLFEPFFTTKPVGMGTGLGLSMVRGFVQRSLGFIEVHSQPNRGTLVQLGLPVCAPPAHIQAVGRPGHHSSTWNSELALLVAEDPAARRCTRHSLLALGFGVLEAESGPEAWAMLDCTPDISLLLAEVGQPGGLDGGDLARAARDVHHIPRVLLIGGQGAPERHGPGDPPLLKRPFSPLDLVAALRALSA